MSLTIAAGESAPTAELEADFYGFQSLLSPEERAPTSSGSVRRAPGHLMPRFAELGMLGVGIPEITTFENTTLYRGRTAHSRLRGRMPRPAPSSAYTVGPR